MNAFRPPVRLCQAGFYLASAAAFVIACWPQPITVEADNSDKAFHFAAFYVLEMLALAAHRSRLLTPALGLVLMGGAIEIVQGLVGRDRDVWDWAADMLGILAAMAPLWMASLRRAR